MLEGAGLVFLIPLRILNETRKDMDIVELMEGFYCSKSDVTDIVKHLLKSRR